VLKQRLYVGVLDYIMDGVDHLVPPAEESTWLCYHVVAARLFLFIYLQLIARENL